MDEQEKQYQEAVNDMLATGCIFLNPVFKIKPPRKKLGKRLSISIEGGEAVWGSIIALFMLMIVLGMFFTIGGGKIPESSVLIALWGPIAWLMWPIVGFFIGRYLAHMSPFLSKSGEGASAWIRVTMRKMVNSFFGKIGLTPTCLNPVITTMRDMETHEPMVTMAKEWIGISPAPSAPWVKNPWVKEYMGETPPQERDYRANPLAVENIDVLPSGTMLKYESSRHRMENFIHAHEAEKEYARWLKDTEEKDTTIL